MKKEIKIPRRLELQLARDKVWEARVTSLRTRLSDILGRSPAFFPDYTKHGIDHVNEVLELADRLIATDTLSDPPQETDLLSPRATAFLVCAIMLHDAGMFLERDGVQRLVRGDRSGDLVDGLDEEDWYTLWIAYIAKVRRMSEDDTRTLFGCEVDVAEDCVDTDPSGNELRVIGEFLRRNHGRLAHEIALNGMPGSEDVDLLDHTGMTEDDRDMIGLLARSHCMEIRQTEEYLKRFNEGPMPHNIPAFYLMAVLRLADYLDAGAERAPEILERLQKIRVSVSEDEWTWNQCIDRSSIHWDTKKHNVRINASPDTSPQFVLVDKWLGSVQQELDLCWSILAEQYPDDRYRLSIHRVISNIRETSAREKLDQSFLTQEVKVTANPKIVQLLIEPLYDDDPTYGVRELLQNAVDACVERKHWEQEHGDPNYKGLVDIRIDGDVFTITDNGMGMNADILMNYYLSAGASYRSSESWKAANAPDGESRVARTGKFGVGFLAAFLLGDKVEVHTQYWSEKKDRRRATGYQFEFDRHSMPLDVKRKKRSNPYAEEKGDPTGTTIRIRLHEKGLKLKNAYSQNPWHNWYAFDEPRVEYHVDGEQKQHEGISLSRDPGRNDGWFDLSTNSYEVYQWAPNTHTSTPMFYCNGIRIEEGLTDTLNAYGLDVRLPHVSVIDKRAALDVDLARRKLKSVPEKETLYREVFCYHIARLLLTPWDTELQCRRNLTVGFALRERNRQGNIPFLLSSRGYSLCCDTLLSALAPEGAVTLYYAGDDACNAIQKMEAFLEGETPCTIIAEDIYEARRVADYSEMDYYYDSPVAFAKDLLLGDHRDSRNVATWYRMFGYTEAIWLSENIWHEIPEEHWWGFHKETAGGIRAAHRRNRRSDMPIRRDQFPINEFPVAVLFRWMTGNPVIESLFLKTFKEVLTPSEEYAPDDYWIPFDMEKRRKKFEKAFTKLSRYMEHILVEDAAERARREAEAAQMKAIWAKRKAREALFGDFKAAYGQEIAPLVDRLLKMDADDF